MTRTDVIRAWKNPSYRRSLSAEAQAQLPSSPAGTIVLPDDDLRTVSGGSSHTLCCTCAGYPASLCTPCPPQHCF